MSDYTIKQRKALITNFIENINNIEIICAIEDFFESDDFLKILGESSQTLPIWVLYEGAISYAGNRYVNRIIKASKRRARILEEYAYRSMNSGGRFYKYEQIFIEYGSEYVWYKVYENLGFYNFSKYYKSQREAEEDFKSTEDNNKVKIESVEIE